MGHSNIWNSHPKTYGPGSRTWFRKPQWPMLQPSSLKRVGERSDLSCCRISSRIWQQVSNFHLYHDYETVILISDETMLRTTLLNCRIF
ncbi:putative ribosomal protein S14/S29 [Helianthus anomalus]